MWMVVKVAALLGIRTFEVCVLGSLTVFTALAGGIDGPNKTFGLFILLFVAYLIVIRDKIAAARKR